MTNHRDGYLISLAWPETFCKQAGGWYDPLLNWMRISKHNYYKVGHAAVALVCPSSGEVHYFDFGRYHAPFGHGRVRSKHTDHELQMTVKGQFDSAGNLTNYEEILHELANKEACHGSGTLHAGLLKVHFRNAFDKANAMQAESPIPYGPLLPNGTNCSRFVRSVMKAGVRSSLKKIQLHLPLTVSPTPVSNVKVSKEIKQVKPINVGTPFCPTLKTQDFLNGTLPEPPKPEHLPSSVQWLSGEGAGSWFHLEAHPLGIAVKRYDAAGTLECHGIYRSKDADVIEVDSYCITHPSHCERITLFNEERLKTLLRI